MLTLTPAQVQSFQNDGFVVVEGALNAAQIEAARGRFELLFAGKFQTGLYPDEWNWRLGRDREDLTRQICNGWKSDLTVASIVLRADVGQACAKLHGWPGARLGQDNVIWKPPGTKPLGFHQDDSYNDWIVPADMLTCWITLDDTKAYQGTIEHVRGSHRWPLAPPIRQFHAPDDPTADLRAAAGAAGSFVWLAGLSVLARTLIYLACVSTLPVLHRRERAASGVDALQLPGGPAIPLLAMTVCAALLTQVRLRDWLATAAMLGIGALLFAAAARARRTQG